MHHNTTRHTHASTVAVVTSSSVLELLKVRLCGSERTAIGNLFSDEGSQRVLGNNDFDDDDDDDKATMTAAETKDVRLRT